MVIAACCLMQSLGRSSERWRMYHSESVVSSCEQRFRLVDRQSRWEVKKKEKVIWASVEMRWTDARRVRLLPTEVHVALPLSSYPICSLLYTWYDCTSHAPDTPMRASKHEGANKLHIHKSIENHCPSGTTLHRQLPTCSLAKVKSDECIQSRSARSTRIPLTPYPFILCLTLHLPNCAGYRCCP